MKFLTLVLALAMSLLSANYAVVVDAKSAIKHLSQKQIKDIFVMKRNFVEGKKVVPANMPSTSQMRERFEKVVLKTDREKLNSYWIKQHFHGVRPPVVQSSESSMKLFVKNVNGAVGYLPISSVDSGLRVLFEF